VLDGRRVSITFLLLFKTMSKNVFDNL